MSLSDIMECLPVFGVSVAGAIVFLGIVDNCM